MSRAPLAQTLVVSSLLTTVSILAISCGTLARPTFTSESPSSTITVTAARSPTPIHSPTASYTAYIVQTGDSLWSIANRFGTTVAAIMELNGITSTLIYSGTQLRIPSGDSAVLTLIITPTRPDTATPPPSTAAPRPSTPTREPGPAPLDGWKGDDPPTSSVYDGVGEPGLVQTPSPIPCVDGETVALIQDNVPWWVTWKDQDPLGANVNELKAQGKDFCILNSEEIESTNLGQFGEILISAAQNQTFYDNIFPDGEVHPALTAYVEGGGILSANLTDYASGPGNNGNWSGDEFVGGVLHVKIFYEDNSIAAPTHPIIAGALPCPSGNCGTIVDEGEQNDLDSWYRSSHGYFTNLPPGTIVILTQRDVTGDGNPEPVMIEYPFGKGLVIATLTTTEWRYSYLGPNLKLLANEIAYQDSLAMIEVDIDIKPGSDPNSINCNNEKGMIAVAILTTEDFDATAVDHTTVSFEGASHAHVDRKSGEPRRHEEDVDGDGDIDLVFHFRLGDTDLTCDATEGTLMGATFDGQAITGADSVRMIDRGSGRP